MLWWFAPRRWFNFGGRAARRELLAYWVAIFVLVLSFPFLISAYGLWAGPSPETVDPILLILALTYVAILFGGLLALVAVKVRRLHDQEKSGWNLLWALLPLLGGFVVLVLLLMPGEDFANRYGPDPRNPDPLRHLGDLERIF
jgi:uncharacterized membrane protein YhaH (DUF805 family)